MRVTMLNHDHYQRYSHVSKGNKASAELVDSDSQYNRQIFATKHKINRAYCFERFTLQANKFSVSTLHLVNSDNSNRYNMYNNKNIDSSGNMNGGCSCIGTHQLSHMNSNDRLLNNINSEIEQNLNVWLIKKYENQHLVLDLYFDHNVFFNVISATTIDLNTTDALYEFCDPNSEFFCASVETIPMMHMRNVGSRTKELDDNDCKTDCKNSKDPNEYQRHYRTIAQSSCGRKIDKSNWRYCICAYNTINSTRADNIYDIKDTNDNNRNNNNNIDDTNDNSVHGIGDVKYFRNMQHCKRVIHFQCGSCYD